MTHLNDNQIMYRAYLKTPLWQEKRLAALNHYGPICMRCGEYGNDVHHKTYERVGGDELMEDFEILCRECHEAHHEAERVCVKEPGIRAIHRRAIFTKLRRKHIKILQSEFPDIDNIYMALNFGSTQFADRAAQLLGMNFAFGKPPKIVERNKSRFNKSLYDISYKHIGKGFAYHKSPSRWRKLNSLKELPIFVDKVLKMVLTSPVRVELGASTLCQDTNS